MRTPNALSELVEVCVCDRGDLRPRLRLASGTISTSKFERTGLGVLSAAPSRRPGSSIEIPVGLRGFGRAWPIDTVDEPRHACSVLSRSFYAAFPPASPRKTTSRDGGLPIGGKEARVETEAIDGREVEAIECRSGHREGYIAHE